MTRPCSVCGPTCGALLASADRRAGIRDISSMAPAAQACSLTVHFFIIACARQAGQAVHRLINIVLLCISCTTTFPRVCRSGSLAHDVLSDIYSYCACSYACMHLRNDCHRCLLTPAHRVGWQMPRTGSKHGSVTPPGDHDAQQSTGSQSIHPPSSPTYIFSPATAASSA